MEFVLNRVLDFLSNFATFPMLITLAVRDVANARQRHALRELGGERGESWMQTANQRTKLTRAVNITTTRNIVRETFRSLDCAVHTFSRTGVVVWTVVRTVLDARDGADRYPK